MGCCIFWYGSLAFCYMYNEKFLKLFCFFWHSPFVISCKRIFPKEDNGLTKKSACSIYTVRYQGQPVRHRERLAGEAYIARARHASSVFA